MQAAGECQTGGRRVTEQPLAAAKCLSVVDEIGEKADVAGAFVADENALVSVRLVKPKIQYKHGGEVCKVADL